MFYLYDGNVLVHPKNFVNLQDYYTSRWKWNLNKKFIAVYLKMDIKNNLALKKKRELLGALNKRKMSLRKYMDNLKQNECRLDITQITKCVFLGSLCLKPVPQLFDSPLLLEELDMKFENIKTNGGITINDENVGESIQTSIVRKTCLNGLNKKVNYKRKYLITSKTKKKSLREKNESNNNIFNSVKDEQIKLESNESVSDDAKVIFLPETKSSPKISTGGMRTSIITTEIDEPILDETDPLDIVFNKETLDLNTLSQNSEAASTFSSCENNVNITTSEIIEPTQNEVFDNGKATQSDIVYNGQENLDQKILIQNNTIEKIITTKEESYHIQSGIIESLNLGDYEDEESLLKRESTPELLISDSDDDTIDQLMYNIMDIKIGTNVFDNKDLYNVSTPDIESYEECANEFNEKINSTESDEATTKDKKLFKRTPQCKICSRVFPSYIKLKKHKMEHNGDKPYICLKCEENYPSLDQLIAHLRTHQGKRPYVCKKCNKDFKTMKALENHQPVHVLKKVVPPKKTFMCEICSKEFSKLCDLERHTRVHTGEKPSVCNICNKRFQQQHNLNKHLLIHTQEKPFQCDICNKKFGRSDVLNRHLLTHSVKKPNHCEICMKTFIRVSQLIAHKDKYHPEQAS